LVECWVKGLIEMREDDLGGWHVAGELTRSACISTVLYGAAHGCNLGKLVSDLEHKFINIEIALVVCLHISYFQRRPRTNSLQRASRSGLRSPRNQDTLRRR
jgi:hypothetical protein